MCSQPADEYTQWSNSNMTLNSTAQLLEKPLLFFIMYHARYKKNTEKPLLIVWNGFPIETSDTRPRERGIETAPTIIKREKKTKVVCTSKTDWRRTTKIVREKLKWPPRSHDRTRTVSIVPSEYWFLTYSLPGHSTVRNDISLKRFSNIKKTNLVALTVRISIFSKPMRSVHLSDR